VSPLRRQRLTARPRWVVALRDVELATQCHRQPRSRQKGRAEDRAVGARWRTGAQLALQAGRVDLIVSDWLWVSRQRAEGGDLTFIPFSSAIGGLIVPAASPIRDVAGLAGQRLGIAGSALDKSWLVLRLFTRARLGLDLETLADKSFGAPPLLSEALAAGRLDAVLTYWPFVAKLEARGMRRLLFDRRCSWRTRHTRRSPLTGYVVSTRWAMDNKRLSMFSSARRDGQMRSLPLPMPNGNESHRSPGPPIPLSSSNCATPIETGSRAAGTRQSERRRPGFIGCSPQIGGAALVGPSPSLLRGPFSTA